jgi:hypothetical protein
MFERRLPYVYILTRAPSWRVWPLLVLLAGAIFGGAVVFHLVSGENWAILSARLADHDGRGDGKEGRCGLGPAAALLASICARGLLSVLLCHLLLGIIFAYHTVNNESKRGGVPPLGGWKLSGLQALLGMVVVPWLWSLLPGLPFVAVGLALAYLGGDDMRVWSCYCVLVVAAYANIVLLVVNVQQPWRWFLEPDKPILRVWLGLFALSVLSPAVVGILLGATVKRNFEVEVPGPFVWLAMALPMLLNSALLWWRAVYWLGR